MVPSSHNQKYRARCARPGVTVLPLPPSDSVPRISFQRSAASVFLPRFQRPRGLGTLGILFPRQEIHFFSFCVSSFSRSGRCRALRSVLRTPPFPGSLMSKNSSGPLFLSRDLPGILPQSCQPATLSSSSSEKFSPVTGSSGSPIDRLCLAVHLLVSVHRRHFLPKL